MFLPCVFMHYTQPETTKNYSYGVSVKMHKQFDIRPSKIFLNSLSLQCITYFYYK